MFRRSSGSHRPASGSRPETDAAPDTYTDTCVRCGRPTPRGVSLCEDDNPGRIGSPSTTQVHGTIVVGILAGFLLVFLGGRLVVGQSGPFSTAVSGVTPRPDGGVELVVDVTNLGRGEAGANCRVVRRGVALQSDVVFQTGPLAPGATRSYRLQTPTPIPGEEGYEPGRLTANCI